MERLEQVADGDPVAEQPRRDVSGVWLLLAHVWELLPDSGTARCRRVRRAPMVEVRASEEAGAWFEGLVTCRSVWRCPMCAGQISQRRRRELAWALERWQVWEEPPEWRSPDRGRAWEAVKGAIHPDHLMQATIAQYDGPRDERGRVRWVEGDLLWRGEDGHWRLMDEWGSYERNSLLLETRTIRHRAGQRLGPLLERLKRARDWMKAHREYREIRKIAGCVGSIRGGEVTAGRNGWHPHEHELWFCTRRLSRGTRKDLQARLAALWIRACSEAGLAEPSEEHGLRLDGGDAAKTYVAKWGAAEEIALSRAKKGRGGDSPWQLLERSRQGDEAARALWLEYARAYHGQRQLHYTRGLRKRLGLDEYEEPEAPASNVVVVLQPAQWTALLRAGREAGDWGRWLRELLIRASAGQSGSDLGEYVAEVVRTGRASVMAGGPGAQGPPDTS